MLNRVVVTGLGCVTPVGNDPETFFTNLTAGRHGIGPITRFDASVLKVGIAAEVRDFDPLAYMEKTEARRSDLYAHYAIAAASQAVTESGIDGAVGKERLGVYIGSGIGGFDTFNSEHEKFLSRGPSRVSPFFIPMMIANMASALVAMRYGAMGPNLPVVSACATSTHTVGEAYRAIRHGYCDAVIAGGAEAAINPMALAGFINCMALSTSSDPDRASIPFDRERNGFVMGEGAGVLVLEEYTHAVKRGAKIYCEVAGYGNTCDAYHVTAPHPEGTGAELMIKNVLEEANLSESENLYINPHGTSTPMNDRIETAVIHRVFGERAISIPVSSTKSMTGHLLGAAGGVEAVASVKVLEKGVVPPTVGLREPDPECDLDYVPEGARPYKADAALSLSLGFGGHNAGILFRKIH